MKAPAFWYGSRGFLSTLLAPLALLYSVGKVGRRLMASPYHSRVPVICVGNIVAGGAGKTQVALAIAPMLRELGYTPGFVTRGYGGKEIGPLRVDPARHTAADVGDEALLLTRVAPVWIGLDRPAAMHEAEKEMTHIILDDGLQNPSVVPDLSFLVVDSAVGFGNQMLIPAGPLRESYESAMKRVTAVILIGKDDNHQLAARVQCPLLRANSVAVLPPGFPRDKKFFAFAGIGRPQKFYDTCRDAKLELLGTRDFPDHHPFSKGDFQSLKRAADALGAQLLTTEKDWVRLPLEMQKHVLALPVTLAFAAPDSLKRILGMVVAAKAA